MSSDVAIAVQDLSKCYQIYDRPQDRLKQMLMRSRRKYYREFWALDGAQVSTRSLPVVKTFTCQPQFTV